MKKVDLNESLRYVWYCPMPFMACASGTECFRVSCRCLHEMWDVTKMRYAPRCSLCFSARRCVVVVTSYASSFLYSLSLLPLFYTLFSPTLFYFLFFCSAVFAAAAVMLYCCFYVLKDDYEATCHVLNIGANSD